MVLVLVPPGAKVLDHICELPEVRYARMLKCFRICVATTTRSPEFYQPYNMSEELESVWAYYMAQCAEGTDFCDSDVR